MDRDLPAAETLAKELGEGHFAMELDVRFEAGVERVADALYGHWDRVDVLVNNAGSELNKTYNETTYMHVTKCTSSSSSSF